MRTVLMLAGAAAMLTLAACDEPKPRQAPAEPPPSVTPEPGGGTAPLAYEPISQGLPEKPEFPGFYLDNIGPAFDPLNRPAVVPAGRSLRMDGFGFDPVAKAPAKGVDLVLDGRLYGSAYGHDRPDVADFQKVPGLVPVGFRTMIPATALTPGPHEVVVRVIAADGSGYYQSPVIRFEAR